MFRYCQYICCHSGCNYYLYVLFIFKFASVYPTSILFSLINMFRGCMPYYCCMIYAYAVCRRWSNLPAPDGETNNKVNTYNYIILYQINYFYKQRSVIHRQYNTIHAYNGCRWPCYNWSTWPPASLEGENYLHWRCYVKTSVYILKASLVYDLFAYVHMFVSICHELINNYGWTPMKLWIYVINSKLIKMQFASYPNKDMYAWIFECTVPSSLGDMPFPRCRRHICTY